jgi:soluble lytic murein transglycosylase
MRWELLESKGFVTLLRAVTFAAVVLAPEAVNAAPAGIDVAPDTGRRHDGHTLTGPLGVRDAVLYRRIFALQEAGDLAAADRLIDSLQDTLLLGHVQLQRYLHPTAHRSTFEQLKAWLERYGDHPEADRAYGLARKRRPSHAKSPAKPVRGYLSGNGQQMQEIGRPRYRTERERTSAERTLVREWQTEIEALSQRGRTSQAESLLRSTEIVALLDPVELDLARWAVAQAHFARGRDQAALALAAPAAARSGDAVPEIHWTAGISAWRLRRIEVAGRHFQALAEAEAALPAERARAAFWAARAHLVTFRPAEARRQLELAASYPQSFYGLLAGATLDRPIAYDIDQSHLGGGVAEALLRFDGAKRALALAQVGQLERAEAEIRKLAARATPEMMVSLIALAQSLDLPAAQMRLAQSLGYRGHHAVALYPVPRWQPSTGFSLDRALLYSVVRAESAFDPTAHSHAGARGLMQIMPATARYIADQSPLDLARHDDLYEPETSMSFGQWYLEYLLQTPHVSDNLIFMALAYNAGPGRVRQWRKALDYSHDPLLFLESVPLREPRVYVKKVLTNLWSYRARLGQPQPSLEGLAHNRWPTYRSLDAETQLHAWN